MADEWRDIEGFPGYKVSARGQVLGRRGRVLSQRSGKPSHRGYAVVSMQIEGLRLPSAERGVHHLVARAFVPNPESVTMVVHIDGDGLNNNAANLRWASHREYAAASRRRAAASDSESEDEDADAGVPAAPAALTAPAAPAALTAPAAPAAPAAPDAPAAPAAPLAGKYLLTDAELDDLLRG